MDSLKMADFIFTRIREAIIHSQYIAEVRIGYEYDETYGNRYIRLQYSLDVNDAFEALPFKEQERMFKESSIYTFQLATHNERNKTIRKKEPLRVIEFRYIYESLTSYAYLQLKEHFPPEAIKIKEIDFWSKANYAEQYLDAALKDSYFSIRHATLDDEAGQWKHLHELAARSKPVYRKHKQYFGINDRELHELFSLPVSSIRSLLLDYNVAIKVKGEKTIDEIRIYIPGLLMALKKELLTDFARQYYKKVYQSIITYLYDQFLPHEKTLIIQQQQSCFLQQLAIRPGDILELKDGRIVCADVVEIDARQHVFVTYFLIKNDLHLGQRSRTVSISDIAYVLKQNDYQHYIDQVVRRHLSLLKKWMKQRKMVIEAIAFEPDLSRLTDIENVSLH